MIESQFLSLRPLTLSKLADLLSQAVTIMNHIDLDRETHPIFSQRLREEWEDALINRYIQKEATQDVGPAISEEERRQVIEGMAG